MSQAFSLRFFSMSRYFSVLGILLTIAVANGQQTTGVAPQAMPSPIYLKPSPEYLLTYIVTTMDGSKVLKTERYQQTISSPVDSCEMVLGRTGQAIDAGLSSLEQMASTGQEKNDSSFLGIKLSVVAWCYPNGLTIQLQFQRNVYVGPGHCASQKN